MLIGSNLVSDLRNLTSTLIKFLEVLFNQSFNTCRLLVSTVGGASQRAVKNIPGVPRLCGQSIEIREAARHMHRIENKS